MDKKESLALFAQGRDAWNEWAQEKLEEREALEKAGAWLAAKDYTFPSIAGADKTFERWSAETQAWHMAAIADFSDHEFDANADFSGFVFPGLVGFRQASFKGDVGFGGASFKDDAGFGAASFGGVTEFGDASFDGDAIFGNASFGSDVGFTQARLRRNVSFRHAHFEGEASFDLAGVEGDAEFFRAIFQGRAMFRYTHFEGEARFIRARFEDQALFPRATFKSDAMFTDARFEGRAWFVRAQFEGLAGFQNTNFDGETAFDQCMFGGYTVFQHAIFEKAAIFNAIDGKTTFSLADAKFDLLPDFIQAHFTEAPRLDNIEIERRRFWRLTLLTIKAYVTRDSERGARWQALKRHAMSSVKTYMKGFKGDRDRTACWQALKRLAIQAHDHVQEQIYFKGELKSRRWSTDRPWHAVFWVGLIYQVLSDFGRSMVRPLLWWTLAMLVFAVIYLTQHPTIVDQHPTFAGRSIASVASAQARLMWFVGMKSSNDPTALLCEAAPGDPVLAALDLSLRKGLLFPGVGSSEKLSQIYRCLYGIEPRLAIKYSQAPRRLLPNIPDVVGFLGLAQNLISVVLIFLFLLAVRNHFRIK